MRLLLDTHTFIWWVEDSPLLSQAARDIIVSSDTDCFVSLASAWEMAIKASLGKLKLSLPVQQYFAEHLPANHFQPLGIRLEHATAVETLPFHHRDPFDRLLAAQAQQDGLALVSVDSIFDDYGVRRIW